MPSCSLTTAISCPPEARGLCPSNYLDRPSRSSLHRHPLRTGPSNFTTLRPPLRLSKQSLE